MIVKEKIYKLCLWYIDIVVKWEIIKFIDWFSINFKDKILFFWYFKFRINFKNKLVFILISFVFDKIKNNFKFFVGF